MDNAQSKPLFSVKISRNSKPSSALSFWLSKSVRLLKSSANASKRFHFDGMVVNSSLYCASPNCLDTKMDTHALVNDNANASEFVKFLGLNEVESGESNSSSKNLASEMSLNDENNSSIEDLSSPSSVVWNLDKYEGMHCQDFVVSQQIQKPQLENSRNLEKEASSILELEMMKERFSKLLLGEDMSGCGNGVCTALAISNAITNLCATIFGQIWRLQPLPCEKRLMWRREIEWILSVSEHIVELIPSWQTFPDGSKLEVMMSRPRLDLHINLPALRKLDNMLVGILDSFERLEFRYVDQGVIAPEVDGSSSFRKPLPGQEDKWWLPVPQAPPGGLNENSRKMLQHKRDCTNQILKAAMAINSSALAEMDIPDSYMEALPKNAKASLGDLIHRYINSDQFSPECLLDCLDLSSEHQALEIANRVEASIYIWRRRRSSKPTLTTSRSNSRSSWEMVKELVKDTDKRELLADRAESLLLSLKLRFPGLPQTTLDTSKIQCNKDVGKSILESYSRVLESLAFNVVARIDDLLYVDDLSKHTDQPVTISNIGTITHKSVNTTPYKTAFTTPTFSPALLISPAANGRVGSPFHENNMHSRRGFDVKRILTDYLGADRKTKSLHGSLHRSGSCSSVSKEVPESPSPSIGSSLDSKEVISLQTDASDKDE